LNSGYWLETTEAIGTPPAELVIQAWEWPKRLLADLETTQAIAVASLSPPALGVGACLRWST
jgi:hypothetical protein